MGYTPLIKKMSDSETSAIQKYQRLFIGSKSLKDLLLYEVLTMLCVSFPGALGYFLRNKLFPFLFNHCGKKVFFGRNITIRVPKQIYLGSNLIIDDNAVLDAKGDPEISFLRCGDEVEISRNTIMSCKDGSITIGSFVSIGRNVLMSSGKKITIGDNCNIGPFTSILASGHGWDDPEKPAMLQNRGIKPIEIENNVWIGAHVTVMDGVKIGEKSIISVGSVVANDIPPYCIAGGVPARVISRRKRGDLSTTENANTTEVSDIRINDGPTRNEKYEGEVSPANGGKTSKVEEENIKVSEVVFSAIDILNEQLDGDERINKTLNEKLFEIGGNGKLDSLKLLNLIVALEETIQEKWQITISLMQEQSEMQTSNPFDTIGSLIHYIDLKIKEAAK